MIDNAVSLFDGIGGFPLALSRSYIPTVATAEIDESCRGVARRQLQPHKQFYDVQELTGADLYAAGFNPETGILTAGWPCQGNSVAGRRGGMGDPRSGLWREVGRLLGELRPEWFIGENVPGLLTVRGGRDFLAVIKSLDELGYGVAWRVLDAQNFGVPQRRRRVFIVGCLGDGANPAEILFDTEGVRGDSAPSGEAGTSSTGAVVVGTLKGGEHAHGFRLSAETAYQCHGNNVGPMGTLRSGNGGLTGGVPFVVSTLQGGGKRGYRVDAESAAGGHLIPQTVGTLDAHEGPHGHGGANVQSAFAGHYIPYPADGYNGLAGEPDGPMYALSTQAVHNRSLVAGVGVRRLTPLECERLQGFPDGWTAGQSDSARYRQLGNAVAVPVVEWLTRRIVSLETTSNAREAA